MGNHQQLIKIREKKLGVILLDARIASNKSSEDMAQIMGVSIKQYHDYESGQKAPSLPEIEILANFLKLPLDHFWGNKVLSSSVEPVQINNKLRQIRDRIIGTRLRLARTQTNISIQDLSKKTSISATKIKQFELGEKSIPLPELEALINEIDIKIDEFYDLHNSLENCQLKEKNIDLFLQLSPEIQEFFCKPSNRPYLELAIRLSELTTEKLRLIAESLLEIVN